jgi:hypothetical protein
MAMRRMEGMRSMSFLYVMVDNGEGGTSYKVTGFLRWKLLNVPASPLNLAVPAAEKEVQRTPIANIGGVLGGICNLRSRCCGLVG